MHSMVTGPSETGGGPLGGRPWAGPVGVNSCAEMEVVGPDETAKMSTAGPHPSAVAWPTCWNHPLDSTSC